MTSELWRDESLDPLWPSLNLPWMSLEWITLGRSFHHQSTTNDQSHRWLLLQHNQIFLGIFFITKPKDSLWLLLYRNMCLMGRWQRSCWSNWGWNWKNVLTEVLASCHDRLSQKSGYYTVNPTCAKHIWGFKWVNYQLGKKSAKKFPSKIT